MKQLLILSGKGGTGKTTIASAFIYLAKARAYADCDVDAPNLHLIVGQASQPKRTDYHGMSKAVIDPSKCSGCGLCRQYCRFDAISQDKGYAVDPFSCEGCGVCEVVCPSGAVSLHPAKAGELILYAGGGSVFSTAELRMGSGTTGMLVTEVKRQMKTAAASDSALAVIDGSPGIGCPVIASMSGVDMVLIVAEPSISGLSDLERIVRAARIFQTEVAVCVNKWNTNPINTQKIEAYCVDKELPFMGRIPFDPEAVHAINSGKTITELNCPSGDAVKKVFNNTIKLLEESERVKV